MKKRVVAALLTAAALRLASMAGLGETAASALSQALGGDGSLTVSVSVSAAPEATPSPTPPAASVSRQVTTTPTPSPSPTAGPLPSPLPEPEPAADIELANATAFELDVAALLAEGVDISLPTDGPQVLIIHTHGSEAYTPDEFDSYVPSDPSRTEDLNYNVVRVGDELTELLTGYGLEVLHDRELYDYPSYPGSYGRSAEAIETYLAEYPDIGIVIDLHRDAIGTGDTVYKTQAELSGVSSAQVMLVVGTGENGLYHPNWRENLKLALLMQRAMGEKYPTLARPLALKPERYNQQLTTGSLILEVGSSGNTLREALTAIRLFADAVGPVLAELDGDG